MIHKPNQFIRTVRFPVFKIMLWNRELKYKRIKKYSNGYVTTNINGSKMQLSLNDKGISKDLILDGIRETISTKLIKEKLKEGDFVIDIGANIGYYALLESIIVGKSGKVFAFEPNLENFSTLKHNIYLNGRENIQIFNRAIAEKNTSRTMFKSSHSNWHSFINHGRSIIGKRNIFCYSLDNIIQDIPDFIRMDVEGYEWNVIKGMNKILNSRKLMTMYIEFHPHTMGLKKSLDMLNILKESGFDTTSVIKSVTVLEIKVMNEREYNYNMNINELIRSDIAKGKLGAFEIFFERK